MTRTVLIAAALATCLVGAARASVDVFQTGVFALLGGTPKVVSKFWAEHHEGLTATLKVRQFEPDGTTPIVNYDLDMGKLMHLVIVRDDFVTFVHFHPEFDAKSGTFSQTFTKQIDHKYYAYADSAPRGISQQVFRFTMESDGPVAPFQLPATASPATSTAGGSYTVTLSKTTLTASAPATLDATIKKSGKLAKGLVPYLGAAAHVVLVNTKTLEYVHVHPSVPGQKMNMAGGAMHMDDDHGKPQAGPNLQLNLPGLPSGVYKAWFQFAVGNEENTMVAPFTIVAK